MMTMSPQKKKPFSTGAGASRPHLTNTNTPGTVSLHRIHVDKDAQLTSFNCYIGPTSSACTVRYIIQPSQNHASATCRLTYTPAISSRFSH